MFCSVGLCLFSLAFNIILEPTNNSEIVIRTRRFLGREYQYCLQTPSGNELHVRTMLNTLLPIGTRVNLLISGNKIRLFPVVGTT